MCNGRGVIGRETATGGVLGGLVTKELTMAAVDGADARHFSGMMLEG